MTDEEIELATLESLVKLRAEVNEKIEEILHSKGTRDGRIIDTPTTTGDPARH